MVILYSDKINYLTKLVRGWTSTRININPTSQGSQMHPEFVFGVGSSKDKVK